MTAENLRSVKGGIKIVLINTTHRSSLLLPGHSVPLPIDGFKFLDELAEEVVFLGSPNARNPPLRFEGRLEFG